VVAVSAAHHMIAAVREQAVTASVVPLLSVPVVAASAARHMVAPGRVPKAMVNVVPLLSVLVAEASVARHMVAQDKAPKAMASVDPLLSVPVAEVNADHRMVAPARALVVTASAVLPTSVLVAEASVVRHMVAQDKEPEVTASADPPTNVPEAEVNADHRMAAPVNRLSRYVREIRRGDRYIFINPNIPRWIVTDRTGKLILSLFDGTMDFEGIVDTAVEGFGEDNRVKITEFCSKIINSGLLDEVEPQRKEHKLTLSSVHLSLSDRCNLNCIYCYARERKEKDYPLLDFEMYCRIVDDILKINKDVTFTLTGGEPLLNSDCLKIAEYIRNHGAKVFLLSNGILIDEGNIERIASLFNLVTLSVDGPDDKVHSMTRGHNFDRVMDAVNLLERHGVEYTLSMTVTRNNISFVEKMAAMFGSSLNFAPYFPVSGDSSLLSISGIEYYEALKSAAGVRPLGYCESSLDRAMESRCHKCAIGDGEFSISATGDVYPCQLLHSEEFFCGNVHDQSIGEIYRNSLVLDTCSRLDVDSVEGCRECPIKYICGGSCRARAFYESGDIASSSEFCRYEQEAFYDGIVAIYSKNSLCDERN